MYSLIHRPHRRKSDHFADALAVGEKHAETINADAKSAHRRHAEGQGLDKILVDRMRRLVRPALLLGLFEETRALLARIVKLTEGVGDFPAIDESLETLRHIGPLGPGLGERRNILR